MLTDLQATRQQSMLTGYAGPCRTAPGSCARAAVTSHPPQEDPTGPRRPKRAAKTKALKRGAARVTLHVTAKELAAKHGMPRLGLLFDGVPITRGAVPAPCHTGRTCTPQATP